MAKPKPLSATEWEIAIKKLADRVEGGQALFELDPRGFFDAVAAKIDAPIYYGTTLSECPDEPRVEIGNTETTKNVPIRRLREIENPPTELFCVIETLAELYHYVKSLHQGMDFNHPGTDSVLRALGLFRDGKMDWDLLWDVPIGLRRN